MRQDNEVNAGRSILRSSRDSILRSSRDLFRILRARLTDSPRHAVTFGLVAAIGTTGLLSATSQPAPADMAKAAIVAQATDTQARDQHAAAARSITHKAATHKAATHKAATHKAVAPKPVAGYNAVQMKNAALIVKAGEQLGISKRGQIIAVATAMQESKLYNLASDVVPESLNYPHQGTGADFDSVGLFQQRYTTGWGTIKSIMNPSESAKKFYRALQQVDGWQNMPITVAAQTVQGSAFPDAYAQHTANAAAVVDSVHNAEH
jgi:hypothetical protein